MAGLKRDIPTAVSNENDKRKERKKARTLMSSAMQAWSNLKETFNGKLPTDLKEVADVRWIDAFVDSKIDSINNVAGTDLENVLPQGQINYLIKRWQAIRETAHKNAAIIGKLYEQYPTGRFHFDKFGKYIVCDNLDEIVEMLCATEVPSEVKEFYRLFANWHDDFKRLNAYAREHGFHEFTSTQVNFVDTPKAFVDAWLVGGLSVVPTAEMMARRQDQQTERKTNIVDRDGRAVM